MSMSGAWIIRLSFCLVLISMIEIFMTLTLLLLVPNFLYFTNTHICTSAGLIASLVTLPAAIKIHGTQRYNKKDFKRTFHVDNKSSTSRNYVVKKKFKAAEDIKDDDDQISYQWILIIVCIVLHVIAVIITFFAMGYTSNLESAFMESMKKYKSKTGSKLIVDQIQIDMACCGVGSYKDWYKIDWTGSAVILQKEGDTNDLNQSLDECTTKELDYLDEGVRWDTVPFSCCRIGAQEPCVHRDLEQLGATTININGCHSKILARTLAMYLGELALNGFLLVILFLILMPNWCQPEKKDTYTQFTNETPKSLIHSPLSSSNMSQSRTHHPLPRKSQPLAIDSADKQLVKQATSEPSKPTNDCHIPKLKKSAPIKQKSTSQPAKKSDSQTPSSSYSSSADKKSKSPKKERKCCKSRDKSPKSSQRSQNKKPHKKNNTTSESTSNDETVALWTNFNPYTLSSQSAEIKPTTHEEHLLKNKQK